MASKLKSKTTRKSGASAKTSSPQASRKAWTKALRSGDFKKGVGALGGKKHGFCCLGVGCVVTKTKFKAGDGDSENFAKKVGLTEVHGPFIPTKKLAKWIDARANEANKHDPEFVKNPAKRSLSDTFRNTKGTVSLVECNDTFKLPFPVIAEIIDMNPKGLFKDGE